MINVKRILQVALVTLVCLSGTLLGLSQGNPQLLLIAIIGAVTAFIVVDWLELFQLKGWLANMASIIILVFAMKDFLNGDSAVKLVAVSNLLVYLQTVLMFQEKTPRLNWQVMVLSLLQIVVAAIFNLNFEGGILFIIYFAVAGITMVLQSTYAGNVKVVRQNRRGAKRIKSALDSTPSVLPPQTVGRASNRRPIAIYDSRPADSWLLTPMIRHLFLWLVAGLTFASVLFYIIPRGNKAWFGPAFRNTLGTGVTKRVNLEPAGIITLSGDLIMRSWFEDKQTGEPFQLQGPIYFRGMALASYELKDGKTQWSAPYDRIYPSHYKKPLRVRNNFRQREVVQRLSQEATSDPLLHTCMPATAVRETDDVVEFCSELDAFTRRRQGDTIEFAPFKYVLGTLVDENKQLLQSWPFYSDTFQTLQQPMENNPGQKRWLLRMEREHYPNLVKIAEQIASQSTSRLELVNGIRDYFLNPNTFKYSLNYTDVTFDRSIDPIEDFVTNYRKGHCEMFASAMTLMLRSQGIPSRYVVGFYGGEFNALNQSYVIRERHAHAWVEAYLRPEDCTQKMFDNGAAGPGGAWLTTDPTPPTDSLGSSSTGDAMDLARTLWQDYVLGLTESDQGSALEVQSSSILGLLDLSRWSSALQSSSTVSDNPVVRVLLIAGLLLLAMFGFRRLLVNRKRRDRKPRRSKLLNPIRRFFGSAISIIAPTLGKWVMGDSDVFPGTAFYHRMSKALGIAGFKRQSSQTHREFADLVTNELTLRSDNHPDQLSQMESARIAICEITNAFYEVRFGGSSLDKQRHEQIEQSLHRLEKNLSGLTKQKR